MLDLQDALRRLSCACAPAGYEGAAADIAAELLRGLTDDVRVDRLGNVVGRIACGIPNAKTVLWDAHLDEVGVIVNNHQDGYLTVQALGGADPRALMAQDIHLLAEPSRRALVACLPPHVQSAEDREKCVPMNKLYLDVGLPAGEAEKAVPVGTPGCFAPRFVPLQGRLVSGKAFDDRAGFAALLRALEILKGTFLPVDIVVVGSVQEETGSLGAAVTAFGTEPRVAFAVDATFGTAPDVPKRRAFALGSGVAVGVGPHMNRTLSEQLLTLAEKQDIAHQTEIMAGHTGTNGSAYQTAREGVSTAVLSFPVRNMHTPVEILHMDDLEATARLLAAWTLSPEGGASL